MLGQKLQKALNEQIAKEFYSSYLYLAMAAYFESKNLRGFAKWMRVQAMEESCHAMIIYNYVLERGGQVSLAPLDGAAAEFSSPLEVFEKAFQHEQMITASINSLTELAIQEKDHASRNLLNWFVDEQVEEEANASEIVEKLKLGGANDAALLFLDGTMGARVFTLPVPLQGKI